MQVHARFFAAAKAAVGRSEAVYELPDAATLADLIGAVLLGGVESAADDASRVFARCSFIVDGVSTTDTARALRGGATVDILPPFAGG